MKIMHKLPRLLIFVGALLGMASAALAGESTLAKGQLLIEVKTGDSPAAIGHEILLKNCARCHAIDTTGDSPLAKAPPFREVMKRYAPSNLEEALAEGIVTGHNEMPEFTFEPGQIAAIVAYLSTLQVK